MNQEVLFQFGGDFSKLDKEIQARKALIAELQASASRISFGGSNTAGFQNYRRELGGVNTNLNALKSRLNSLKAPFEDINRLVATSSILISKYDKEVDALVRDLQNLIATQKGLSNQINTTNKDLDRLNATTNNLSKSKKTASENAIKLGQDTNGLNGIFGSFGGTLQRLIPFLSALFVVNTVKDFLLQLYEVNRQFELFELKARAALDGSRTAVEYYYQALKRIDIKSLFDIEELETGTLKLLNRRVKLTEAELQALANTAEAVGTKGAQSYNQIVEALLDAQVGQFRRLEELGVGVDATGEKLKLTFAGITTEVDKGSQAVVRYILNMDKMNGAQQIATESANTLEGKVSSLKTQFNEFLRQIYNEGGGKNVFDFLISSASGLLSTMKSIVKLLNDTSGFGLILKSINNYNKDVEEEQRDQSIIASGGFRTQENLDTYRKELRRKLNAATDEFNKRFYSIDPFGGEKFFNPANIKNNATLVNYQKQVKAIIEDAKRVAINTGQDFDSFVKIYDAINNEIEARRLKEPSNEDKSKADRLKEAQKRILEQELEAQRALNERKLELERKYLNDRLRFLEQGSVEYLELKKEIDLKEIELDKQRSLEIVRNSLVKRVINSRGVETVINPTDVQVNDRFRELGFERIYQESRRQVEEETNDAILERRTKLYEEIESALENSLNREIRVINRKYDEIQNRIDKAKKDASFENIIAFRQVIADNPDLQISGITEQDFVNETPEVLAAYEARTKAMREYEIAKARLIKSQTTPETAGKSVIRDRYESRESFKFRSELTKKKQELSNEEQLLAFAEYISETDIYIASDEAVQDFIQKLKDNIEKINAEIENLKTNARSRLTGKEAIIAKVFKIKVSVVRDEKTGEIISETISDEDRKAIKAFENELGNFLNYYNSFIDGLIDAQQRREQSADESIDNLKNRISEEQELRAKGLANSSEQLQTELAKQQQIKFDAQQKQEQLNKAMVISNLALQGTELTLAVAKNFKASADLGPIGVATAIVSSLALLAFFASAVSQVKSLSKFEKGGIIDFGDSHAKGGSVIEAERGEFVVNKTTTKENRTLIENINKFKGQIKAADLPKVLSNTGIYVNESSIEGGKEMVRQDTLIREKSVNSILSTINLEKEVNRLGKRIDVVAKNTEYLKTKTLMDGEGNIWEISDNKIEKTKTKV